MRVTITLVKKSYAVGALEEIVKASAERVEPACPVYKECGGCQLQHLSYKGQLECKRQQVQDALTRIGHLNLEHCRCWGRRSRGATATKCSSPRQRMLKVCCR